MRRMGIQVLHDPGLGRYYPSRFRSLLPEEAISSGQELDPLGLKYPDRAECGVVNLEHHLFRLLGRMVV